MTRGRTVEEVLAAVAGVDGWMSAEQGRRLYAAAAFCPPGGRIVEIGSFRGRSTIVLASAAHAGVEVVAIDPHAGNDRGPQQIAGFATQAAADAEVFASNLVAAGVHDRVRHVAERSTDAHSEVGDPIDVLYIDGAHRYRAARADIRDWGARVADDGTMLVHDAFSSIGVTMAIAHELVLGRRFRYVGRSRSLVEYRADLAGRERWRNAARQLSQLPWFARNVAVKVAITLGWGKVVRRLGGTPPEWPY